MKPAQQPAGPQLARSRIRNRPKICRVTACGGPSGNLRSCWTGKGVWPLPLRPVQTGEVKVRKEVVTETKHSVVPIKREEVVMERRTVDLRPASGAAMGSATEEIRIPVKKNG